MIRQEHVLATGTTLGQFCNIPLPWFGWTSVGWFGLFWPVAWHRCHLMSAQQATQRAKLLLEVHIKHQSQRFGQYFLDFQGPMCMPTGRFGSFNAGWKRLMPYCHHNQVGRKCQKCQRGWSHVCLSWPSQQICLFFFGCSLFHDQRTLMASKLMHSLWNIHVWKMLHHFGPKFGWTHVCPQVAEHCVGCELWGPQKAHQSFLGFDMLVMGKNTCVVISCLWMGTIKKNPLSQNIQILACFYGSKSWWYTRTGTVREDI